MSTAEKITVREIYDITEKNYDWESFKYVNPRKYTSPVLVKGVSGGLFGNKNNYLDELQKAKKIIPGPTDYKADGIKNRPKSGKMDKKERTTISSQINAKSKKQNIPGPGAYFKRPQSAQNLNHSNKSDKIEKKNHYLNQVQFMAINSPGVGEYNLTQPRHVPTPNIMKKANKSRIQFKQERLKPIMTMKSVDGTFECKKKEGKKNDSKFFGSSKRFTTPQKSKMNIGPSSYRLNMDWSKDTNVMKRTATQLSLFSGNVYYR